MRKQKADFKNKDNDSQYYDLISDYELIEASFAQQYGIRLRNETEMQWGEFTTLLAGLNEKTPLGRIVAIRAEKNPKIIKDFTPEQKRIRNEWTKRKAKTKTFSKEEYEREMEGWKNLFKSMAK